ncbi:MAG: hypothetical protein R2752_13790 [Vicinamibacterales bacterium]
MGKRELVIIAAFLVVGAIAYRFTAPPAAEGQGFSLSRLLRGVREEVNPASATRTHTGRITAAGALREVRISGVRRLVVTGEDREDIEYSLEVRSTGPDEATAGTYADQTVLETDDLGDTLTVGVDYPAEASQTAGLTLKVPSRLAVRLAGRLDPEVTGVAALHLEGATGDVTGRGIRGPVTGSHRSGRLTIEEAASVDVTLQAARADLQKVTGGIRINGQSGEVRITDSSGDVEIEQRGVTIRIEAQAGMIRVGGSGGEVRLTDPAGEVRVDTRSTEVEVTVGPPVPMRLLTSGEPLRLILDASSAVTLDAIATSGGAIQAEDWSLTPEKQGDETRLAHTFGAGTARIVARDSDGDIVIRRRK